MTTSRSPSTLPGLSPTPTQDDPDKLLLALLAAISARLLAAKQTPTQEPIPSPVPPAPQGKNAGDEVRGRKQGLSTVKRAQYSLEFKLQAVGYLLERGLSVAKAADALGIPHNSLHNWKKLYARKVRQGSLPSPIEEIIRLRQENKRLLSEQNLFKQLASYLAKEPTTHE